MAYIHWSNKSEGKIFKNNKWPGVIRAIFYTNEIMHPKDIRIEDYRYELPDEQVAKYPLPERDASRLLIYKDGIITEDSYRNIAYHLPAGSLMVFNQTKVVHARLLFKKASGGVIEIFCLAPAHDTDIQTAMLQKGSVVWECLIGGASKWKHGLVLQLAHIDPAFTLSARITERMQGAYIISLSWDNEDLSFAEVLHYAGKVPLPPYLHRDAEVADENRYQTLFAKEEGSVAAPTAGLHFTNEVLSSLSRKGIAQEFVTLHVGAGTFKPVKSATMEKHDMHAEWLDVSLAAIHKLVTQLGNNQPVIAVGTTSLRTLESLYHIGNKIANGQAIDFHGIAVSQWEPYNGLPEHAPVAALAALANYLETNGLHKIVTRTQVLIAPGYTFKIVDGLVTNFHQPESTLLLLVAAFIGSDWRTVYQQALNDGYRFLSYGDGSLLWRRSSANK